MAGDGEDLAQRHFPNGEMLAFVVALGALLGFGLGLLEKGLPRTQIEVALVTGLGTVAVVCFVLAVNELRVARGLGPLIGGIAAFCVLAVVTAAALAGLFLGLAPAEDEAQAAQGDPTYARHLQFELGQLQRAGTLSDWDSAPSRRRYAERARAIGELYEEVAEDLRLLAVDREDRLPHRNLARAVAAAGRAFRYLANAVSGRSAGASAVGAARTAVERKLAAVDTALRALGSNGYSIQTREEGGDPGNRSR